MRKRKMLFPLLVLALALLLWGCGPERAPEADVVPEETTAAPAATVPPDGNPNDVTCKGSYSSGAFDPEGIAARAGDHTLTNGELQVWYAMAVAARRQETVLSSAPDYHLPLDTQLCPLEGATTWQQYFLKQALNAWHSAVALEIHARENQLPTEEDYQPDMVKHRTYVTGMPASKVLYGYNLLYHPNSMHQAYLDALPETLDDLAAELGFGSLDQMAAAMGVSPDAVTEAVRTLNYSYMYFTTRSYYTQAPEEEPDAPAESGQTGRYVDIRQILLVPGDAGDGLVSVAEDGTVTCSDLYWEECQEDAQALLTHWLRKTKHDEAAFADLAYKNSEDPGSALDGGAFRRVRQGQLAAPLDAWCFDEARQPGDTEIIRSPYGCHILFFSGSQDISQVQAEEANQAKQLLDLTAKAREKHPLSIDYSAITLTQGDAPFSFSQALYPDIAHERFPEVPLYLQQDYPKTMYGAFRLTTNGCGITSMAMLASYLADEELTPPIMCQRYGNYSHRNGTDGMIFNYEPSAMGFYLREKTYEPSVAKAALEEGQIVISVQHPGYWTRGGHYIVLEDIDENGMVQVRDSNIYNFARIPAHAQDRHTWNSITSAGSGFWIYEDKVTRIPMCSRCGDPETPSPVLREDYICGKCTPALLRRSTYLSLCQ